MLDPRSAIDFPKYVEGAGGSPQVLRPARPKASELAWCKSLMDRYEKWRHLLDLEPAERIVIEYPCRFGGMPIPPKSAGLPRIDGLVWHDANRCSLIETKTRTDPSAVMGGVGQLIYYKAWMERVEGAEVAAMVLAAPTLPLLVLEAIQDVRANIRFLKVTDDLMSGLVPRYDEHDNGAQGAQISG